MVNNCINKNTNFYKSLLIQGFDANEIAQITDKLSQEGFIKWYGKGDMDTFDQPRLIKDLYLVNDKGEQITLNDLLNDKFYEKRQNYSQDLTSLDKINTFLEDAKIGITKRISAYRGSNYAERLTHLLDSLAKINDKDYLQALEKHSQYILSTIEDFEMKFYNHDKINAEKLSKEDKTKRDKAHKNFLIHANDFLQTFSKIKNLDLPVNETTGGEIVKNLKEIETRVSQLQNRVNDEIETAIRNTLNDLISNPDVRNGVIDFLAAQTDESKVQLLMDALGDSHITFIAAIDKFYKKAMFDKDEESKRLIKDWNKFVEGFKGNFDQALDKILEKKNGKKTGRFIPKYSESYYSDLYKHLNKLKSIEDKNSQEFIDALDEYYTWKKENQEQKYKKEYYDALNLLTPKAREAKEKIDTLKSEIVSKKNLTLEDFEQIEQLDKEMKALKSLVNPDGSKKEGDALEIANSLFQRSKAMANFYYTQGIKQASFDKAKREAKEKGDEYLEDWMKYNTVETFTDEFWDFFKRIVGDITKSDELVNVEDQMKQLLITYRNEKGEVKVEDIPKNILTNIKQLQSKKDSLRELINEKVSIEERKKRAEEFNKLVKFEPSSEYVKTIAEKKKVLEELESTQPKTSSIYLQAKREYDKWFAENHEMNIYTHQQEPIDIWMVMKPRAKKFIKVLPSNRWKITDIKPEFHNTNFSLDINGYPNPTDKWISDDYKNLSEEDLSNLDTIQKKLLYLTEHTKNDIIKKGFLPAIPVDNRTGLDILKNKKVAKGEEFAEKAITESDEIVKFIPFKYVKKLNQTAKIQPIPDGASEEEIKRIEEENEESRKANRDSHSENLNYDLANTMRTFIRTALTNKYKTEIELDIKLFKEQLKRQKIKRTDSKGGQIFDKVKSSVKGSKVDYETSAIGSNAEKHFNEWLEGVFYEDFELNEGILSDWSAKVQNFTSLRALGFNVLSGVNNKLIGNLQARIESAGGVYFDYKDYRRARRDYFNSITHIITNHKTPDKSTNKVDGFIKYFDVLVSQDELSNRPDGLVKSALHRVAAIKNGAFFMQHLGEHQVQNASLLSMGYSHRIVDGKIVNFNEFYRDREIKINFDKKMTNKELEEAMKDIDRNYLLKKSLEDEFEAYPSVFDSFELKDNELHIKDGAILSSDEIFNFKQRVIGINQRLHGIYNIEDAGTIQRYALGRLAIQFRKWMRPGWNRRFGSKFGKKIYNERIRDFEEGIYVSAFKFLADPFIQNYQEYKKSEEKTAYLAFNMIVQSFKSLIGDAKIRWHSMSEIEKAGVKKTAAEFLFLLSVIGIGFLAKNLKGDDDDDNLKNKSITFMLYQADRLFGELTTFTPIGVVREGNRLFSSPSPVFNTLEDVGKLATSLFLYPFRDEEERVFKSGIYHGKDKVGVYAGDMIPVYNQWLRIINMNENNQRYGLFK